MMKPFKSRRDCRSAKKLTRAFATQRVTGGAYIRVSQTGKDIVISLDLERLLPMVSQG